jgi:hypothetical protein
MTQRRRRVHVYYANGPHIPTDLLAEFQDRVREANRRREFVWPCWLRSRRTSDCQVWIMKFLTDKDALDFQKMLASVCADLGIDGSILFQKSRVQTQVKVGRNWIDKETNVPNKETIDRTPQEP